MIDPEELKRLKELLKSGEISLEEYNRGILGIGDIENLKGELIKTK